KYVGSPGVYRCPGDRSMVLGRPALPRSRSYSRNCWLNDDPALVGFPLTSVSPYDKTKYRELANPSQIFGFIDEHQDCIDDGSMRKLPGTCAIRCLPQGAFGVGAYSA